VDALIVGAGIGGLTAAIALRRAGWRPVVLERAEGFAPVGAGISVFPNAVHCLRELGLADRIDAVPAMHSAGSLHTWRGARITSADPGLLEERFGAPLLIMHRAALHELLLGAVEPDVVRLGAEVTGFAQDAAGVTVRLAGGEELRSALLVGADGLRSVVRRSVIGDGAPRYAGYLAWRGIAEGAGPVGEFWGRVRCSVRCRCPVGWSTGSARNACLKVGRARLTSAKLRRWRCSRIGRRAFPR
jgi:2-polyprenyl-6-methoxyphenol hydroxylase-like FAD-dependent oxidoreductase